MSTVKPATLTRNLPLLLAAARRIRNGAVTANKAEFHRAGRAVLRSVLTQLGVDGEVRSCLGGPAVGGEVVLHTEDVYVCLTSGGFYGEEPRFYFRTVEGRNDYVGGPNRWYTFRRLAEDLPEFVAVLRDLSKPRS